MTKKQAIKLFEEKKVRTVWDDEQEKWYFSIVDVCDVLTESKDATAYWRKLKQRLKAEGNETVTNCHALKLRAADGKMRRRKVYLPKGVKEVYDRTYTRAQIEAISTALAELQPKEPKPRRRIGFVQEDCNQE